MSNLAKAKKGKARWWSEWSFVLHVITPGDVVDERGDLAYFTQQLARQPTQHVLDITIIDKHWTTVAARLQDSLCQAAVNPHRSGIRSPTCLCRLPSGSLPVAAG